MTPEEEKNYLINLLIDSTAWQISEGEVRSAIELEVIDRVRKLNNMPSINVVGTPSGEVDVKPVITREDFKDLEAAKLNEHLASLQKIADAREKWKSDKVRCQENGKTVWHPMCECHKEKLFPHNPKAKKFRWVWDGPQSKQAQLDAMWEEHDRSCLD